MPSVPTNSLGEPTFASGVTAQQQALKYTQLFIEGSLASQNTTGGSSLGIIGTGAVAPGIGGEDKIMESRMYDLNYLRYYTGYEKLVAGIPVNGNNIPAPSDAAIQLIRTDGTGTPWTAYDSPTPGYLWSPVAEGLPNYKTDESGTLDKKLDLGATYIYFDPTSPTLPGFSSSAGGQQSQLPQ